jgi:hypothetical protein
MPLPVIDNAAARSIATSTPGPYKSRMLERYLWFLAKCEKPHLLDVGPVCERNIAFFLENSSKLSVCDVVRRLSPHVIAHLRSEEVLPFFNYDKNGFDGIHLWDMADHFETSVLTSLVHHLSSLLKPSGLVMMLASNSPHSQPFQSYFVAGSGTVVTLKQVSARSLPYFFRSNRDIEMVMKPFQKQDSFVCMNGVREFLFRR